MHLQDCLMHSDEIHGIPATQFALCRKARQILPATLHDDNKRVELHLKSHPCNASSRPDLPPTKVVGCRWPPSSRSSPIGSRA